MLIMYLLPYLPPIFQNDAVTPSMKVSEVWTDGYTGKGVIIAIVDDGLQTDHPDLKRNVVKKHIIILYCIIYTHEKLEDTKGVIRSRNSKKDRQYSGQHKKRSKEQTTIYKTLNRKLKIE